MFIGLSEDNKDLLLEIADPPRIVVSRKVGHVNSNVSAQYISRHFRNREGCFSQIAKASLGALEANDQLVIDTSGIRSDF